MTIQTFTAGQTLTAAQMNTLQNSDFNFTRNVQSGTSYTLALGDKGKLLEFENTGTITLTIPANSSVGFEIGDRVDVLLTSTGSVNISPASGVTLNAEGGLTAISSQWTRVTLIKRGLDAWVLTGGTGEVQTGEIKDSAVTNAKLAANSVTSDKIANGTIVNDDVSATAGILDTKLATISTADKVSLSALNIDGATDIGAAIVDADLIVVDDGGNGTNRKAAATRISDYVFGKVSGDVLIASNGAATIQANSVALGTDTTGNYVASLVAGTGITITNNSGEGATPTIAVTGSTYQPLDAELTALAGTTSAADALPYFTGAGTATTTTLTSFGRSLIDDADAAAARTTLGVGTADSPTFAGATIDAVQVGVTTANEIDTTSGNLVLDSAGGTVAIDDNVTVTGGVVTTRAASTQDAVVLQGRAGGTNSRSVTLTPASLSASRTLTLPDKTGTVLTDADLGANVSAFLATPSSANLASAVTDETGTGALVFGTSPTITPAAGTTATATTGAGYMGMPQTAPAASMPYTLLASDAGKHIYVTTTGTVTIPANGTTAFPIGTTIVIVSANGVTTTVSITTDTLRLANSTSTGSRTIASNGMATLLKLTSTLWIISGNGVT